MNKKITICLLLSGCTGPVHVDPGNPPPRTDCHISMALPAPDELTFLEGQGCSAPSPGPLSFELSVPTTYGNLKVSSARRDNHDILTLPTPGVVVDFDGCNNWQGKLWMDDTPESWTVWLDLTCGPFENALRLQAQVDGDYR